MRRSGTANLDDIRRSLRLGHGPVPGRLLHLPRHRDPARRRPARRREASASLRSFLQERWKGMWPILYGDQLRQARFDDWIFQGLLDVEHLPRRPSDWSDHSQATRRRRRRHRARPALTAAVRARGGAARACSCWPRASGATHLQPVHDRRARLRPRAGRAPRRGARRLGRRGIRTPPARRDRRGARLFAWLQSVTDGVPLRGRRSRRTCCCPPPSARSSRRRSSPETMAAGDLRGGGELCVVGFRALKDFHAPLLADNLAPRRRRGARGRARPRARSARRRQRARLRPRLRRPRLPRRGRGAARRPPGRRRARRASRLCWASPARTASGASCRTGSGGAVFEVPTLPPSVPGMRVFAILRERAAARRRADDPQRGRGRRRAGGRTRHRGARPRAACARSPTAPTGSSLATGGFAAGGLELDSRWRTRETALGLPVSGVPGPGEERFRAGYFDDHPMARAGVAVDRELRPVARRRARRERAGGGRHARRRAAVAGEVGRRHQPRDRATGRRELSAPARRHGLTGDGGGVRWRSSTTCWAISCAGRSTTA